MSGGYRGAHALAALLTEINARAPRRDKRSDGWIGDTDHRNRTSDHNPWVRLGSVGIVTARDFDHDPTHGADMREIAEEIRVARDPRVKYLIFQGRILRSYAAHGLKAWQWGPYAGVNAHKLHLHVSVKSERKFYDDTRRWLFPPPTSARPPRPPAKPTGNRVTAPPRTLREGMSGDDVRFVQAFIGGVVADGVYGPKTTRAVVAYQRMRGIAADGVVGPATWAHIRGKA